MIEVFPNLTQEEEENLINVLTVLKLSDWKMSFIKRKIKYEYEISNKINNERISLHMYSYSKRLIFRKINSSSDFVYLDTDEGKSIVEILKEALKYI